MEFILLLAESETQVEHTLNSLQERYQTALLETGDPVNTDMQVGDPVAILYFSSFGKTVLEDLQSLRRNYLGVPLIYLHDLDGRIRRRDQIEPLVDAFLSDVPPASLLFDIIETQIKKKDDQSATPPPQLPGPLLHDNADSTPSAAMQKVMRIAKKVAPTDATILLTGESGTGKEVTARWIHQNSQRKGRAFVAINCGAITETILESELFGHKKGSFTGADNDKTGLFEAAHQGTLFLDEIGEMPYNLQVKLLRVLQERKIRKVGDVEDIAVNVRIIAATNRNLKNQVKNGEFREDLYYRFNVVPIHLPPLRERRESIPQFLEQFLFAYTQKYKKPVHSLSPATTNILMNYEFPGNIRELQNIVEYAVIMSESTTLQPQDLPIELQVDGPLNLLPEPNSGGKSGNYRNLHHFMKDFYKLESPTLEQVEQLIIMERMQMYQENQKQVADSLGISRTSLWRKLKEYKLSDKSSDS